MIAFSISTKTIKLSFTTVPLIFYTTLRFCYYFSNRARTDCSSLQDFLLVLSRTFFAAQTQIIFLRIDEIVTWDWSEVFWIFWVWFSLVVGITFGVILMLLSRVVSKLMGRGTSIDVKGLVLVKLICIKLILVSSLSIIGTLKLLETNTQPQESTILKIACALGILFMGFEMIFSCLYHSELVKFFERLSNVTEVHLEGIGGDEHLPTSFRKSRMVRRGFFPKFLKKITSTYFKPSTRTEDNRAKSKAKASKPQVKKNGDATAPTNATTDKNLTTTQNLLTDNAAALRLRLGDLKKTAASTLEKEEDGGLQIPTFNMPKGPGIIKHEEIEIPNYNSEVDLQRLSEEKSPAIRTDRIRNREGPQIREFKVGLFRLESIKFDDKAKHLSEFVRSGSLNRHEQSNSNCLICYEKPANAVIMDCGHGGLCIDCAIESWTKKDCCYLCREKVSKVLQVSLTPRSQNDVRVLACTEKIDWDEPPDDRLSIEN
eukprot:TRINITY_DN6574_c0_g1_i14.p1 TRINITY_DN6574_c0_g1~~TRINITY_DN6574_c0_g1_i14.p1  ORF type:complete len:486 (+),score=41.22 TRINITY_DN6574_c0_g1_i14:77-1534(+)